MKMHYTISPNKFVPNARGMSRLTGAFLPVACTTVPAHFRACPPPFGRSRRF